MTLEGEIADLVRSETILPVIGSGVSVACSGNARCASWTGLLTAGVERIVELRRAPTNTWGADTVERLDAADSITTIAIATEIRDRLTDVRPGEFRRWVLDAMSEIVLVDPTLIEAIGDLSAKAILTTNYDSLLDQVLGRPPIRWDETNEMLESLRSGRPFIGHLHGAGSHPETIVLSASDYRSHQQTDSIQDIQRAVFLSRPLLFVGCGEGLRDPNFSTLLSWGHDLLEDSSERSYALLREDEADRARSQLPSTIVPVAYGSDHADLLPFVRSLVETIPTSTTVSSVPRRRPSDTTAIAPQMAPNLPEGFVARPELLERTVAQLVTPGSGTVALGTRLVGSGGYGKTTLAAAVARDPRVSERFPDGTLWLVLGQTPDLDVLSRRALAVVLDDPQAATEEPDPARALRLALDKANMLLVLDDAWQPEHLAPFRPSGTSSVVLVTTRQRSVADMASSIQVDEMTDDQSVTVLLQGVLPDGDPPDDASLAKAGVLCGRLGNWPLLVSLANGVLRRRVRNDLSLDAALDVLADRLLEHGVLAFDHRNARSREQAVRLTIEVSVEALRTPTRRAFERLVIIPEDTELPPEICQLLWERSPEEAEEELLDLADASLVEVNRTSRGLSLHDEIRDFLIRTQPDVEGSRMAFLDKLLDPEADEAVSDYLVRHGLTHALELGEPNRHVDYFLTCDYLDRWLSLPGGRLGFLSDAERIVTHATRKENATRALAAKLAYVSAYGAAENLPAEVVAIEAAAGRIDDAFNRANELNELEDRMRARLLCLRWGRERDEPRAVALFNDQVSMERRPPSALTASEIRAVAQAIVDHRSTDSVWPLLDWLGPRAGECIADLVALVKIREVSLGHWSHRGGSTRDIASLLSVIGTASWAPESASGTIASIGRIVGLLGAKDPAALDEAPERYRPLVAAGAASVAHEVAPDLLELAATLEQSHDTPWATIGSVRAATVHRPESLSPWVAQADPDATALGLLFAHTLDGVVADVPRQRPGEEGFIAPSLLPGPTFLGRVFAQVLARPTSDAQRLAALVASTLAPIVKELRADRPLASLPQLADVESVAVNDLLAAAGTPLRDVLELRRTTNTVHLDLRRHLLARGAIGSALDHSDVEELMSRLEGDRDLSSILELLVRDTTLTTSPDVRDTVASHLRGTRGQGSTMALVEGVLAGVTSPDEFDDLVNTELSPFERAMVLLAASSSEGADPTGRLTGTLAEGTPLRVVGTAAATLGLDRFATSAHVAPDVVERISRAFATSLTDQVTRPERARVRFGCTLDAASAWDQVERASTALGSTMAWDGLTAKALGRAVLRIGPNSEGWGARALVASRPLTATTESLVLATIRGEAGGSASEVAGPHLLGLSGHDKDARQLRYAGQLGLTLAEALCAEEWARCADAMTRIHRWMEVELPAPFALRRLLEVAGSAAPPHLRSGLDVIFRALGVRPDLVPRPTTMRVLDVACRIADHLYDVGLQHTMRVLVGAEAATTIAEQSSAEGAAVAIATELESRLPARATLRAIRDASFDTDLQHPVLSAVRMLLTGGQPAGSWTYDDLDLVSAKEVVRAAPTLLARGVLTGADLTALIERFGRRVVKGDDLANVVMLMAIGDRTTAAEVACSAIRFLDESDAAYIALSLLTGEGAAPGPQGISWPHRLTLAYLDGGGDGVRASLAGIEGTAIGATSYDHVFLNTMTESVRSLAVSGTSLSSFLSLPALPALSLRTRPTEALGSTEVPWPGPQNAHRHELDLLSGSAHLAAPVFRLIEALSAIVATLDHPFPDEVEVDLLKRMRLIAAATSGRSLEAPLRELLASGPDEATDRLGLLLGDDKRPGRTSTISHALAVCSEDQLDALPDDLLRTLLTRTPRVSTRAVGRVFRSRPDVSSQLSHLLFVHLNTNMAAHQAPSALADAVLTRAARGLPTDELGPLFVDEDTSLSNADEAALEMLTDARRADLPAPFLEDLERLVGRTNPSNRGKRALWASAQSQSDDRMIAALEVLAAHLNPPEDVDLFVDAVLLVAWNTEPRVRRTAYSVLAALPLSSWRSSDLARRALLLGWQVGAAIQMHDPAVGTEILAATLQASLIADTVDDIVRAPS